MQYQEGTLFDGRYVLLEYKGSGSFGEVWRAQDSQTELEVAIKIYIAMDQKGLDEFKREYQIAFDLNHANLLHANYLAVCAADHRPYLVMPYCDGGSISGIAGTTDEAELWVIIRDVAAGLAYLHSQNPPIIHQDIKPDNILAARRGTYVITDFGISKQARSSLRRSATHLSSAGAVAYMGPEKFSKQYHSVKASDIWSLGVTIYEIATGELPFCGMGGSLQRQGADIPDLPEDRFSDDMNQLMRACLTAETWDRPTAAQIADYATLKVKGKPAEPTWRKQDADPVPADSGTPQPDSTGGRADTSVPSTGSAAGSSHEASTTGGRGANSAQANSMSRTIRFDSDAQPVTPRRHKADSPSRHGVEQAADATAGHPANDPSGQGIPIPPAGADDTAEVSQADNASADVSRRSQPLRPAPVWISWAAIVGVGLTVGALLAWLTH